MKHLELIDLPEDVRAFVAECETSGKKTSFDRNGRPVAVLVSWDEYLALRETIEVSNDAQLVAALRKSDAEAERGAIEQPYEDLERIRVPKWLAPRVIEGGDAIRAAFASIDDDPISGAPLFEPVRGLWSHRDGALRIVYRIVAEARFVLILAIVRVETP